MSATELIALVCCDLGGIVRGRAVLAEELEKHVGVGVGWVPANHSLTPHGPLAQDTPFGSTGDLRLLPDPDTRVRVESQLRGNVGPQGRAIAEDASGSALDFLLCDILETDGRPWECCPRRFLREALADLKRELGARVVASFEHEFQLLSEAPAAASVFSREESRAGVRPRPREEPRAGGRPRTREDPPAAPFSLEALRRAEPFAAEAIGALVEAGARPERIFAEFAAHQFEIPVEAAEGMAAADRAVVLREVVREVARRLGRRATFTPLLDPAGPGNGVHIHLSLRDAAGAPLLHDAARPASLSDLGGRFAAGILRRARALSALTAPSPVSAARLRPHRWSAGAVCLGERNREALLRIPPVVALTGVAPAEQLHLEYRGADASANPYLALGALLRAGLDGVRAQLPAPPILDRDPAKLDMGEAERYGVGGLPQSLAEALEALESESAARMWMYPTLYEAYVGIKRAELAAVADLDIGEVCRRYAQIY